MIIAFGILMYVAFLATLFALYKKYDCSLHSFFDEVDGRFRAMDKCRRSDKAEVVASIDIAETKRDEAMKDMDQRMSRLELLANDLDSKLEILAGRMDRCKYECAQDTKKAKYSDEFRNECVNYYIHECTSLREAARMLEVPYSTLKGWVKKTRDSF